MSRHLFRLKITHIEHDDFIEVRETGDVNHPNYVRKEVPVATVHQSCMDAIKLAAAVELGFANDEILDDYRFKVKEIDFVGMIACEKRKEPEKSTEQKRREFQQIRDEIFKNLAKTYGKECNVCGETSNLTVDHMIPLSQGGSNRFDNLQILCQSCNSSK